MKGKSEQIQEQAKRTAEGQMEGYEPRLAFTNDDRAIMAEVRLIGGALITILIVALVLTEVYGAVDINESSPFGGIVNDLETTGVAAISLLVVGLLVVAASAIMGYFGGGFNGRR